MIIALRDTLCTLSLLGLMACANRQTAQVVPVASVPTAQPPAQPAAATMAAMAALTTSDTSRATVAREYRGSYTTGFEMSWFEPCDAPFSDRMWWVTLTDEALAQRDSILTTITRPPTNGLAVRWRGTISPRMPSGHMGRGSRYMLVTAILEIRPLPPAGACTARDS